MVSRSALLPLWIGRASGRGGFTLLEIVVVMVLAALLAAAVGPSLVFRAPAEPTLDQVIAASRDAAVARSQSLRLVVTTSGDWNLRLPSPYDSAIASGSVAKTSAPSGLIDLRLSPLGTCVAARPLPPAQSAWDAARCTSVAAERP